MIIKIIIMIKNNGNRQEKERERDWERAIMYYYSTVTSKMSNVVIFTNHTFFAYILYKTKIQHNFIGFVNNQNYYSQCKDVNFLVRKFSVLLEQVS